MQATSHSDEISSSVHSRTQTVEQQDSRADLSWET